MSARVPQAYGLVILLAALGEGLGLFAFGATGSDYFELVSAARERRARHPSAL
jgi:hypothetical protein